MTKSQPISICLLGLLLLTLGLDVSAAICTSNSGSRNWNTAGSWNCGRVPVDGDAVVIPNGSTVTLDVHTNQLASLTINAGGKLTIASGKAYDIFLGGNLVNNGIIDFLVSSSANTIFLQGNNVISTFSGTGTWLLDNLDLNGSSANKCTGSCYVELSGSPNLQFNNNALFAALSGTRGFNSLGNATATVTFIRAGAQTIATNNVTYPNLVLAGSGTKTAKNGNLNILGGLTISSGTTFDANNNDPTISIAGRVVIENGGVYLASNTHTATFTGDFSNSGTYTGSNGSVALGGNFSNSGSFSSGAGPWTFQGAMGQSIVGASTFQNLVLNNASGLILNNDVTVSTLLTLTNGKINTGANTLIASANCPGSQSRSSGHVIGKLRLTFPSTEPVTCVFHVGDANNYAPITVTKTGTNSGTLTGSATTGDHPDTTAEISGINVNKSVNGYWTLTGGTLPTGTTYEATFQFCTAAGTGCGASAVDSGSSPASFIIAKKTSGVWTTPTVGTRTANTTQATGLSSFGDFAIGEVAASSGGPHHLEIRHASGSGITCIPDSLTIVACQDAACSSAYTGGVSGTLTSSGAPTVNWVAGTGFSIPAGSGATTGSMQVTTAGSVVFGIGGTSPLPANATTCNFGSPSCTFTAADSGFLFSVPDHAAEVSQTVTVSAVKKADISRACIPAFANVSKAVTFTCGYQNPLTGSLPIRVGGKALNTGNNASAACDASGQSVSLVFNASGIATTTVQYADVGNIQLNARYTGVSGSEAGLVMTGSDTFIAAPSSFGFSGITAGPIKAGKAFSATVSVLNAVNDPTPNFGKETPAEGVTVSHLRVQPTGPGAVNGTFSGGVGGFTGGSASASNLVWSEVGTIALQAILSSASYLGSGLSATGSSGTVGAFVPDHFDTAVTQGCASGGFTYSAQPLGVRIKAMNGAATPAVTQNYDGTSNTSPNFAKTITLSDGNAAGVGTLASATVSPTAFTAGVANATPAYTFTSPKTPPTTIKLRAVDANASSSGFTEGTADIRSGRARINNAYGSELIDLSVLFRAEYWNGSAWTLNMLDSCSGNTALDVTNTVSLSLASPAGWSPGTGCIQDSGAPGLSGAGCSSAGPSARQYKEGGAAAFAGDFNLWFRAPGLGNIGSVMVTADVPLWLQYPWGGITASDPIAHATFGIYKTSVIYVRENY